MSTENTLTLNAAPDALMKKLADIKAEAGKAMDAAIPTKEGVIKLAGYTAAAFEYIGIASQELFKSRKADIKNTLPTVARKIDVLQIKPDSISRLYSESRDSLKQRFSKLSILRKGASDAASLESISRLEARLVHLEERLLNIEQHGVADEAAGRRKLGAGRLGLLRQLVDINKELRENG